jgi:tetratricopeptide (TPR) repeat protein
MPPVGTNTCISVTKPSNPYIMNTRKNETNSGKMRLIKLGFPFLFHAIAGLIILFEFMAIYNYMTISPNKIFRANYQPYELHVVRGANEKSPIRKAYKDGKMDSVIWDFNSINSPQPEEFLLAGIAYLESGKPTKAIETFKAMMLKNTNSNTDYFEDDAEYYLAMSYLDNKQPEMAMPIFEKIYANADNPYNSNVSDWFMENVKTAIAKK